MSCQNYQLNPILRKIWFCIFHSHILLSEITFLFISFVYPVLAYWWNRSQKPEPELARLTYSRWIPCYSDYSILTLLNWICKSLEKKRLTYLPCWTSLDLRVHYCYIFLLSSQLFYRWNSKFSLSDVWISSKIMLL